MYLCIYFPFIVKNVIIIVIITIIINALYFCFYLYLFFNREY